MDMVSELKDIWYLVLGLVALVAWSVRLEALVKGLEQKLNVISGMMRPDKQEEHYTWKAHVEKDVTQLQKDVTELRKNT
jgi:hypothetical protein